MAAVPYTRRVAGPRISGWPAWGVIWIVGTVSTLALFLAGFELVHYTDSSATICYQPAGGRVVCQGSSAHPLERPGLVLIALGVAWGCGTICVARSNRV